jgi:hypothetical protein
MPLGGILSVHSQATVALRFSRRAIKPTQRLKIWLSTVYRGGLQYRGNPLLQWLNSWPVGQSVDFAGRIYRARQFRRVDVSKLQTIRAI